MITFRAGAVQTPPGVRKTYPWRERSVGVWVSGAGVTHFCRPFPHIGIGAWVNVFGRFWHESGLEPTDFAGKYRRNTPKGSGALWCVIAIPSGGDHQQESESPITRHCWLLSSVDFLLVGITSKTRKSPEFLKGSGGLRFLIVLSSGGKHQQKSKSGITRHCG